MGTPAYRMRQPGTTDYLPLPPPPDDPEMTLGGHGQPLRARLIRALPRKPAASTTASLPLTDALQLDLQHPAAGRDEARSGAEQLRRLHNCVDFHVYVENVDCMNAQELKKWLAARGCTFESKKGGSGHIVVRKGNRMTDLPMHGSGRELGTGLVNAIKKQLGLK